MSDTDPPQISEAEVMAVIQRIERGEVSVRCDVGWAVTAGGVVFETTDGWQFIVFNDCGQWDYFESIHAPDGRSVAPMDHESTARLDDYHPRTVEAALRWGLTEEQAACVVRWSLD